MKIYKASFLSIGFLCLASLLSAQSDDLYYDPERQSRDQQFGNNSQSSENPGLANRDYNDDGNWEDSEYADEYYYTNRIRRFDRPVYGFDYYDPYYTDLVYVDPWYNPYSANQYSRWNNWNSMNWAYSGFTPSYYWNTPRSYFSFGIGNPWGYNPYNSFGCNNSFGFGYGYNNWGCGGFGGYGYNNFGYGGYGYGGYYNNGWDYYGYNNYWNDNNNQNTGVKYGPKGNGSGGSTGGNPNRGGVRNPNIGNNPDVVPGSANGIRNTPGRTDQVGRTSQGNEVPTRANDNSGVRPSRNQPVDVWNKYPERNERTRVSESPQRTRESNVTRPQGDSRPRNPNSGGVSPNVRPERSPSTVTPRSGTRTETRSERQSTPSYNSTPSRSNDSGSGRSSSPAPSRSSSGGGRRGG